MTPTTFLLVVVGWTLVAAVIGIALGRWLAAVAVRYPAPPSERPSALPEARW